MGLELRNGEEPPGEEEREDPKAAGFTRGEQDSALTSTSNSKKQATPQNPRQPEEQSQDLCAKNRAAGWARAKEGSELPADERCLKQRQARRGSSSSKIT